MPREKGISLLKIKLRLRISIEIDVELRRDGVDQSLAHERTFEPTGSAVGTTRRFVGETDVAYHPIGAYTIWPRQHGGTKVRYRCPVCAYIGTLIVPKLSVDSQNVTCFIDCARER